MYIKLQFISNKVEINGFANKLDFVKIVPCIDGQFMLYSEYFREGLLVYYDTVQEAKDSCQQHFEQWLDLFNIRTQNLNKLI
jgi:hypothetical protein